MDACSAIDNSFYFNYITYDVIILIRYQSSSSRCVIDHCDIPNG